MFKWKGELLWGYNPLYDGIVYLDNNSEKIIGKIEELEYIG